MPVLRVPLVTIVMLAQQIFAEVVGGVAPHRVNVVGVVLRVVELDQERRPVQAVIMRPPRLDVARPSEMDVLETRRRNLR